ncbi:hypothetical protein B0H13DRAFT_2122722 [Mycena leptocephala]|nr:hypothetical protein B0H13DRAFT_2122722 [Mycena leptocephala]
MNISAELVCTVVLQVQNTLYHVYLVVFRDTFSIPQPSAESEKNGIEGCPVVQLHDKAEYFTRFMKAIHDYGNYKTCPASNFTELDSILRLSDKYDVSILRDIMISVLSDLDPNSLDKWNERKRPPLAGYSSYYADHVRVLNLAVKLDIRAIQPVRPELLAREEEEDECATTDSCDAERLRWMGCDLQNEVMNPLANHNKNSWQGKNFAGCLLCLEGAKERYQAGRKKSWDDLPSIFDLGTGKDLLPPPAPPS